MACRTLNGIACAAAIVAFGAGAAAQDTAPRLSLTEALQLIEAAEKEATAKSYRLSFAVVDARGDLLALSGCRALIQRRRTRRLERRWSPHFLASQVAR